MSAPICGNMMDPGETFEHWCGLAPGHVGDHRCGDCHDVWNQQPDDDEWPDEPHERWDGTCQECRDMRGEVESASFSSQAGLASFRRRLG